MRKATDTTLRNIATLASIPAHPHSRTTRQIREDLLALDSDFEVDVRSVQRDLEKLSRIFPITSDTRGRANHWYWVNPHALTQIPSMSGATAFALKLAAEYLKPMMPPSVLLQLEPYFRHADKILADTSLGRWADKAALIRQGPLLNPPAIRNDVQGGRLHRLAREPTRRGGVSRQGTDAGTSNHLEPVGLGCSRGRRVPGRDLLGLRRCSPLCFAPHGGSRTQGRRRQGAARISARRPIFGRDRRFSYPLSTGKIELKALFDAEAALHLIESRLAAGQRTTEQADGRFLIEATVPDTADLRWWLLGFGATVEVGRTGVVARRVQGAS